MTTSVVVVGAGPVGCACALALHNRGYSVRIYESRQDPRLNPEEGLRSINLAMSARGLNCLRKISPQTATRVSSFFVPMHGRMIHGFGYQQSAPYGLYGEAIQSISRYTLNYLLLEEVKLANIPLYFEHKFDNYNGETCFFTFNDSQIEKKCDLIVGCDGTFSKVRASLARLDDFDFSQEYIDHYYLEVPIPTVETDLGFAFEPNYLHIWPRHRYMFIALPNKDRTMTGTLFAPRHMYKDLDTPAKFVEFFQQQFPDAFEAIGTKALEYYYESHPRGKLLSTKICPYHLEGKAILLGDAAHSMVPFYGQGLNCGLEDVTVLMNQIDEAAGNLEVALAAYSEIRKPDLDAIYKLSMDNYTEMRSSVTSKAFFFRKWLDKALGLTLKEKWLPLYTMISFRADIPYSRAVANYQRQNKILNILSYCLVSGFGVVVWRLLRRALY